MAAARRGREAFGVEDLWRMERVGAVSLAPDGRRAVAAVTTHAMADNTSSASLWLLHTDGSQPRRLTACGDKDGQPAWSPTGERIAFVAKREQEGKKDESAQLYVIAADGGEAHRVSDVAAGVEAFKWFPDGRRIALVSWAWPGLRGARAQAKRMKAWRERKESGYVTSEAQYRYWDHQIPMGRVAHLLVLDVGSGRTVDLFEGTDLELTRADPTSNAFDVSPDGRRIAFAHDPGPEKRLDNCKRLSAVDVRSRRVAALVDDAEWDLDDPRWSPDGRRLAFTATRKGVRHTAPTLAAVREADGAWRALSAPWDRSVDPPLRWSADGAALFFPAEDRARRALWRWPVADRGAAEPVRVVPGGWVQAFDVADDVVVTVADALVHPARVHAHRADGSSLRLESFNDARLARIRLGTVEDLTLPGANGDPVQVWLVKPPGFDPKRRHPLLHVIHGGPHAAQGDTFHYRWNLQVFAAQGYVVLGVNYHGSSSFGDAFLDSITHRWGELELADVEAVTDWALKQRWADRKRVYASGGSYGGYMVAWMNGHVPPGRYRAYVCHAGCFDWTAMFSDDAYTWHARELGAWYWEDPEQVRRQAPITHAAAMGTATLVVHGALDYRVPDQQGLAYYNTLKARGVDARLLWFPDENHWILKPRNARLWHEEFFAWLARHDPSAKRVRDGKPRAARPARRAR
jgi:dipeptidyl aminopeptidase/acylaminoacyl peptidase